MEVVISTPTHEIIIEDPNNMQVCFFDKHKQYKMIHPLDEHLLKVGARAYPETVKIRSKNGDDNRDIEHTRVDNERIKGNQSPSF